MEKVTSKRWKIAQDSERKYWDNYDTPSLLKEDTEVYNIRAKYLIKKWEDFLKIKKTTKILQIGCGPDDVINYFSKGDKYSIDPLADFYKEKFNIDYASTKLTQGMGENLPYPNRFFDIVLLTNVLDHTNIPEKVLSEIKRVMKDKAIFHFEVFTYQKNFIRIAKVFGKIKEIIKKEIYNVHHPYMFTIEDINVLLEKDFKILYKIKGTSIIDKIKDMNDLKKKKKKSKKLSIRIPALFGLYGIINYTAICKKRDL